MIIVMITRLFISMVSCDNYVRDDFISMVHPVYAHISMRVRIIYVECKSNENNIFPDEYF